MPDAARMGEPRPSAAITSRVFTRLSSLSVTLALPVRVNKRVVPTPARKSTVSSSDRRAINSRRNSQLGKFQPKG